MHPRCQQKIQFAPSQGNFQDLRGKGQVLWKPLSSLHGEHLPRKNTYRKGAFVGVEPILSTSLAHTVLEMGKGHPEIKLDRYLT